ncbi:helix-turn-helix transcriptional regulator [Actinophytocola sp.]|uniref:helix-turn-helix domain-containing protein n=1 Tax=Actinophytocola sp. TaxID=1872138 RepID=UPI0032C22F55
MGNRYVSAAYRELGAILRQAREKAGLTATELAHMLDWSPAMISRMEHGRRTSTTTDVIQYVVMCGLRLPEIQPIVEFTRQAEHKHGYYLSDERIDGSLQSLIFHESSAKHSIIYEPQVIHGLLQTPNYARALITAVNADFTEDWVEGSVRTRMERRRILNLSDHARFTFYIHENALRLRVGSERIMHEQLLHLLLTAGLDHITVRILPSAGGERSAFGAAFHLMEFHADRPIVYLENLRDGGLVLEDPEFVRSYQKMAPMLAAAAMSEGQSRKLTADLADQYDRGSQRGVADHLEEEQLQRRIGNELRGGGMAEEQSQRRRGFELRGGGVVEPPTPIYEA